MLEALESSWKPCWQLSGSDVDEAFLAGCSRVLGEPDAFLRWTGSVLSLDDGRRKMCEIRGPSQQGLRRDMEKHHNDKRDDKWVCLKMLCTPLYPMVLLIRQSRF